MSLSVCVCVFVCVSKVILLSLQHSKHLKQSVLRVSQGCLLEVSRMFQGSFEGVKRNFQGWFKEVQKGFSWKFQECLKEVLKKKVPRVFK